MEVTAVRTVQSFNITTIVASPAAFIAGYRAAFLGLSDVERRAENHAY